MIGDGKKVLVVEDDEYARQAIVALLAQVGFTVVQACDGLQALHEMQQQPFDVVVTDYIMPHLNGLEFIRQSHLGWPDTPVILVSGALEMVGELATAQGTFGLIPKPVDSGLLLSIVIDAVNQRVTSGLPRGLHSGGGRHV